MTDWFEELFGFRETSVKTVRENIEVKGSHLYSKVNGKVSFKQTKNRRTYVNIDPILQAAE